MDRDRLSKMSEEEGRSLVSALYRLQVLCLLQLGKGVK